MPARTLDYASTQTQARGMPLSAMLWCAALIGVTMAVLPALFSGSGGGRVLTQLTGIALCVCLSPLPAALLAAVALVRRRRWSLLVTLASLVICAHACVLTLWVWGSAILGPWPKDEGALAVSAAIVASLLSLAFSTIAAIYAAFSPSWSTPSTLAWHRTCLIATPKVLFLWLLTLALIAAFKQ